MNKIKVIDAYYRGLLTMEECAQILGFDLRQLTDMIESCMLDYPTIPVERA
ncbi:hypothetical protein [Ammoniphilus sp. CFH 90114]|uniref:hypothetical protein n=1 Tax=Ammoniphilus sp. CFH 90114 TaxID=2493665 RepID=UPI0013E96DC1|nr:hypothetical protein [Ammoniphilus sp. CFH 90114]